MTSKYLPENSLIYIAGTDIPHNKPGITDSEALHELESELLEEAYQVFYDELDDNTCARKPDGACCPYAPT